MLQILKISRYFRLSFPKTEKLINWWWNIGTAYSDLKLNLLFPTCISFCQRMLKYFKKNSPNHQKKPLQKDFPGFRGLTFPAMLLKAAVGKCFCYWLNLVTVNLLHICQNHYVNRVWTLVLMATSSICLDDTLAADATTDPGDSREHSGVEGTCLRAIIRNMEKQERKNIGTCNLRRLPSLGS